MGVEKRQRGPVVHSAARAMPRGPWPLANSCGLFKEVKLNRDRPMAVRTRDARRPCLETDLARGPLRLLSCGARAPTCCARETCPFR